MVRFYFPFEHLGLVPLSDRELRVGRGLVLVVQLDACPIQTGEGWPHVDLDLVEVVVLQSNSLRQ
jgi:hypothetical protein